MGKDLILPQSVDIPPPESITDFMTMRPYLMANRPGWLKSRGRIVYDPYRGKMKKNVAYWCVVEVDPEIARYYRFMVDRNLLNITMEPNHGLFQPSGGAHISVIRGHYDVHKAKDGSRVPDDHVNALWKKYQGREVDFLYSPNVRRSGDTTHGDRPDYYWFLEVDCPFLKNIRDEFDLPSDWKLHCTIGRTYPMDRR